MGPPLPRGRRSETALKKLSSLFAHISQITFILVVRSSLFLLSQFRPSTKYIPSSIHNTIHSKDLPSEYKILKPIPMVVVHLIKIKLEIHYAEAKRISDYRSDSDS